jgi:hypothetical protein
VVEKVLHPRWGADVGHNGPDCVCLSRGRFLEPTANGCERREPKPKHVFLPADPLRSTMVRRPDGLVETFPSLAQALISCGLTKWGGSACRNMRRWGIHKTKQGYTLTWEVP